MTATDIRLLAVFVENKPGQTSRVTRLLADSRINIRWVTIASSGAFGVMKLLVNQPELAYDTLRKDGMLVSWLDVLSVEVDDQPGALEAVLDCLATHAVNLANASGFVANGRAILIIETDEREAARTALLDKGIRVLGRSEVLKL